MRFVVRHWGKQQLLQQSTLLQGYGVRLDIRNVEYKVFDDRSDDAAGEGETSRLVNATTSSRPTDFLAGVNLTQLLVERPPGDAPEEDLQGSLGHEGIAKLASSMKSFVSPGSLPKVQGRTLNNQWEFFELEILQKAIEARHLERARTPSSESG